MFCFLSLAVRHACVLAAAFLAIAIPAQAADLIVLTAGAYKPVLRDLIPGFEKASGHRIDLSNDTAGGVAARIARGEDADLIVIPPDRLEALSKSGRIASGSIVTLARSGIGAVVKAGAPKPDIGTVEAFKKALLDAPSIAYIDPAAGGSSGIYLDKLFVRLGIADRIRPKAVLVPGGLTASRVDNGEAAMALQQISELKAVSGVAFVGPLPEELQNYTVYAAAIPAVARDPAGARALIAWLRADAALAALTARGMERP